MTKFLVNIGSTSHNMILRTRFLLDRTLGLENFKALLAAAAEQLGREISVTISRAVLNENNDATYSLHVQEEPDSFYVFTEEDYARELASRKSVSHFKTKKIRDAEAAARRARVTKAIIRVQFPDNYILQVTFQPSDTLVSLTELLKKVISRTDLPFSLYITPPKVHLCDLTKDFYELGLCPGGLVHFVYDIPEGVSEDEKSKILSTPYLQSNIMALQDLHLMITPTESESKDYTHADSSQFGEEKHSSKRAAKSGIKPKWMKL